MLSHEDAQCSELDAVLSGIGGAGTAKLNDQSYAEVAADGQQRKVW